MSAPAAVAPAGFSGDAAETKKYFTVTAALREEYDDNIFTSKNNKVGSFKTEVTPSVLFDYPTGQSDFSARYTFDATYFENRPGGAFDLTHEFVGRFTHNFSDRYSIDVRDKVGYYTEPNVIDGTGTLQRNGDYIDNAASAQFSAQWTPLFGSVSTYSNNLLSYQDHNVAVQQNNMENTGSQDFRFAIQPNYTLVFGGIIDNIDYDQISRGYTSYTGNAGIDWQALPSVSLGGRLGGTYTDNGASSGSQVSPYASLTLNWKLGQKSLLEFDYTHSVAPTDVVFANGQVADRIVTTFRYDVTPDISTHFSGGYTHSTYNGGSIIPGTISSFNEDVVGLDTGATYHLDKHFDFDLGYILTDVSSDLTFREYVRNQAYLGVRGTY